MNSNKCMPVIVGDEVGLATDRAPGDQVLGNEDLGMHEIVDVNVIV